jgi:hypothetical protein
MSEASDIVSLDMRDGRIAEIEVTGKGKYVLPLAIALSDELPSMAFGECLELAERLWLRLEWPETVCE